MSEHQLQRTVARHVEPEAASFGLPYAVTHMDRALTLLLTTNGEDELVAIATDQHVKVPAACRANVFADEHVQVSSIVYGNRIGYGIEDQFREGGTQGAWPLRAGRVLEHDDG